MIIKYLATTVRQIAFASVTLIASTFMVMPVEAKSADLPSVTVNYGDLDLSTTAGTGRLYKRIVAAAEIVCPKSTAQDLQSLSAGRVCRADAIARAVRAVNSPLLAAIHEQHILHS